MSGEQGNQLGSVGITAPLYLSDLETVRQLYTELAASGPRKNAHVDNAIVKKIIFDPSLVAAIKGHFGDDLVLWRTNFFVKGGGAPEVGWHHDKHFEDGDLPIDFSDTSKHFSVLIALSEMGLAGGIVEYLECSHLPIDGYVRDIRPFHLRSVEEHFSEIPTALEPNVRTLPLFAGQFALFHSALMHRSQPHRSGPTRVSMIMRLCRKTVSIPASLAQANEIIAYEPTPSAGA